MRGLDVYCFQWIDTFSHFYSFVNRIDVSFQTVKAWGKVKFMLSKQGSIF